MKLATILVGMSMLCGAAAAQHLLVPASYTEIVIGGGMYDVSFDPDLRGPVRNGVNLTVELVSSEVVCSDGGISGAIHVSSSLIPAQQAKALIHETVHIAQTCDKRFLPVDERIAQDIADLVNSIEGPFVLKELAQ